MRFDCILCRAERTKFSRRDFNTSNISKGTVFKESDRYDTSIVPSTTGGDNQEIILLVCLKKNSVMKTDFSLVEQL